MVDAWVAVTPGEVLHLEVGEGGLGGWGGSCSGTAVAVVQVGVERLGAAQAPPLGVHRHLEGLAAGLAVGLGAVELPVALVALAGPRQRERHVHRVRLAFHLALPVPRERGAGEEAPERDPRSSTVSESGADRAPGTSPSPKVSSP